jgi:uncharacterized membrane protein
VIPDSGAAPAHLHPRVVPWGHAFAWYEEAMRLFKSAPLPFAGLAVVAIAAELLLHLASGATALAAEIVVPLVACGLVYASAAADRREQPSIALAARAFRAGPAAIAAVIAASLITFAAQAFAAWWIADANLLAPVETVAALSAPAVLGVYATGILASLPFTFVPLHVLLERVPPGPAFRASFTAFAQNTLPLLVYAAASLALLGFGLLTAGLGLVVALPLWAASSYAAWKDVFGVRDAPAE